MPNSRFGFETARASSVASRKTPALDNSRLLRFLMMLTGPPDAAQLGAMRVGLSCYNIAASELVELAVAAEAAGFATVWLGEHIVLPVGYGSEHPTTGTTTSGHYRGPIIDPQTELVDPLVALAGVATATSQISLATGIYLAGLRHPLISARMIATLHNLAGGRFQLGVGMGWLEEEFAAVGVEFSHRRTRYEEALRVLRLAFGGGPFEFHGEEFAFDRVLVSQTPLSVPLILGGNTEPALRRAARLGDGWFASGTPSFDEARRLRDRVLGLRQAEGLSEPFPVSVRTVESDPDALARYGEEGFDEVVVWADRHWPRSGEPTDRAAALRLAASQLGVTL